MILELADIQIDPDAAEEFEAAVAGAAPLFYATLGCAGLLLHRSIEHPGRYVLMVRWQRLEDHMVTFRESPAFAEWRALAGPYFTSPPQMHHVDLVVGDAEG